MESAARQSIAVTWPLVGFVGLISLVTMPITAVWFLMLAPLSLVAGSVAAVLARSERRRIDLLTFALSLGTGLLVGPAVYVALAVAT